MPVLVSKAIATQKSYPLLQNAKAKILPKSRGSAQFPSRGRLNLSTCAAHTPSESWKTPSDSDAVSPQRAASSPAQPAHSGVATRQGQVRRGVVPNRRRALPRDSERAY